MLKFLKRLLGIEAEKPSESQSSAEKQVAATNSLSPLVEQAAIATFEGENGREVTDEERSRIHMVVDDLSGKPVTATDMDCTDYSEILEIQHQDAVERGADAIRYVVVTFVELVKEPYPYKIKKKLMEESNGRIMVSLGKYKYSEEDAAEAVKEYECRWDKYRK